MFYIVIHMFLFILDVVFYKIYVVNMDNRLCINNISKGWEWLVGNYPDRGFVCFG